MSAGPQAGRPADGTAASPAGPPAAPRLFYGWIVVAVAFVTMGVSVSARTSFSLVYPQVLDEFGWDGGLTAGAFSLGFLASTAMLPVIGWAMDRFGPRVVIPAGAMLVAAGFALATQADTPLAFLGAMGLMVVNGSMTMSYIVHSMFLPNWFERNRGLAIGIAFSGVGVFGIAALPALQAIIDAADWRAACWAMAAAMLLVAPLNAVLQRRHPADLGLAADGAPTAAGGGRLTPPPDVVVDRAWTETEWTVARAVRTARFRWLALSFACALYVWYAIQIHQTRFLVEIGFSPSVAAMALGLVAFCGIFGQIGIGALSDRIGREAGWTLSGIGFALASALLLRLAAVPDETTLYAMVAAQGLLGAGIASIFGAAISEIFSGPRLARIFALVSLCGNLGAALGAWSLGALREATGDYALGFAICLVVSFGSVAAMWLAGPRQVRRTAGQAARRAL